MAELWSLKVQIRKNITQRKQLYIANLRRLKLRLVNIIFTSNNFNVISFEINQRKTFSFSDKIHFFSLLYEEKLVIFIHLRYQRNLLNGKPVENHFFLFMPVA